ncbi:MAG: PKD domain-containing protein, partial [Bacteroidota bacterium]
MPRIHQNLLSYFAIVCLVSGGSELLAQPFPCDNGQRLYFFRSGGANGNLACFENYTGTPTIVNLCPMPTANHNGLAGNPVDGYLYYLDNTVLNRLSANCTATPVCSLAFTSFYGGFDLFGRYWTVDGSSLVAIDLNSCAIVKGPFPINTSSGMVDLAFNPYDCFIYVGNQRYDTTGTVDPTFTAPPFGGSAQYAGATFGNDGNLYAIGTNPFSTASVLSTLDPVAGTVGFITSFSPGVTLSGGIDMGSFPCYTLEPEFGFDVSGCQPITVSFQESTQGPVGTWTYQWDFGEPSSGAANTSTLANPTHAYAQPGSYQVRLIVSIAPAGLCLASFYQDTIIRTITVVPDTLNATLSTQGAGCQGASTGSASLNIQSGTAPFTYQWSPAVSTGATAANLLAGNYAVVVTDAGGCTQSFSFNIPQPNALVIAPIQVTGVQCAGNSSGTASYSANGGIPPYTYQWSAGTPNGNSVSGLSGGTYQLTVTDASGCVSTTTFNITEPPPLTASLASPAPVCPGNTVVLAPQVQGGTGPYQYTWSNGSTSASLSTIPVGTQTYTLSITDASGCTATGSPLSASISAFPPIVFPQPMPAYALCAGDSVELTAPAGLSSYTW